MPNFLPKGLQSRRTKRNKKAGIDEFEKIAIFWLDDEATAHH